MCAACAVCLPCARRYAGQRNTDEFLTFLKKKLEEDKGFARVEELDKLVKDFVGANNKVCGGGLGGRVASCIGGTCWQW
jgi:predicted esterase YcpF (UPF0227 family)